MLKILICDDEAKIRELCRKYAEFEGYHVTEAENGMQAVELCRQIKFDLVILDVMMPELDGFSAVREIRKQSRIPIILLSARGEEYDRIHGFESGADDYVTKPFSPKELMLRVRAVVARTGGCPGTAAVQAYEKAGLTVNFKARTVMVDGTLANLSPKERALLFYLVNNRNIALSRETLITNVWGYDFYGDDRTLDTHIKTLRKALGPYSELIVTLRGLGYRFDG
ncbi:MAG: response regulator transcription factor [Oscillospiraceae bacterium]|nr:response regulator transcription factor [Oscillospiraceae bacterium]